MGWSVVPNDLRRSKYAPLVNNAHTLQTFGASECLRGPWKDGEPAPCIPAYRPVGSTPPCRACVGLSPPTTWSVLPPLSRVRGLIPAYHLVGSTPLVARAWASAEFAAQTDFDAPANFAAFMKFAAPPLRVRPP